MLFARTRLFLPLFSLATLFAGVLLFLTDRSRTNMLILFGALLLWFLGCAMLIVWSAGLAFRENAKNAGDGGSAERIASPAKRAG